LTLPADLGEKLQEATPRILSALARRHPGQFELCEDAVQDALLTAHTTGLAANPPRDVAAWLYVAARSRLLDAIRSEAARHDRERTYASVQMSTVAPDNDAIDHDDSLLLLFMCCHPALSEGSRVALTLRSVGGLTTEEIAAAYLVPETTMAQRISRAKQTLRDNGARFVALGIDQAADRMTAVRTVLYAIFSEGYLATHGADLYRTDLAREGIRLTRLLSRLAPDDQDTTALLALMLLIDARREARATDSGELVPLDQQDRTRWNREQITEGRRLLQQALAAGPAGTYAIQAAIAAVHADAPSVESTDWPQILALYVLLEKVGPSPMVTLNRLVALAMVDGPDAALCRIDEAARLPGLVGHYRVHAVRAHLLERAGRVAEARAEYRAAARGTPSTPERRYLLHKAARIEAP
jgi:RNA polymerase sigma factor (sigma-70 family)